MVSGHETIETTHDISRKNFAATPTSTNAGHENCREADVCVISDDSETSAR
jgi:hypothetical protein